MTHGKKRITITDVAKEAKVSPTTISFILNNNKNISEKTREKVQKVMKKMGYFPSVLARRFASRRSRTLLYVPPPYHNIFRDPYFGNGLDGMYDTAEKHDYSVCVNLFRQMNIQKKTYLELFQTNQIDGMVVMGNALADKYLLELYKNKYPFVMVNSFIENRNVDYVSSDDYEVGYQAVKYLAGLGHKRIGHVMGPPAEVSARERLRGYKTALKEYGIEPDEKLVFTGDYIVDSGREGMKALMNQPVRPTAVFCANDMMAFGFITEAQKTGLRIPDDVSVLGADNNMISQLTEPKLTTFEQSTYVLCKMATKVLIDRISGVIKKPQVKIVVPMQFIERQSCAAPKTP